MPEVAAPVLLPEPPLRYHAALVTLHWISALLIMAALASGFLVLDKMPNSAPQKVPLLFWHTILEGVILFLLIARFTVRVRTPRPAPANEHPLLNRIAMLTHYMLYAAIALMALSGLATAEMAGLPAIFFRTGFRTAAGILRSNADVDRPFPVCKDHRGSRRLSRACSPLSCDRAKGRPAAENVVWRQ